MAPNLRIAGGEPALITQLRRRRVTFDEIATHLGITRDQAINLYRDTLAETPTLRTAEHRAEELTLIDDAIRDLLTIARAHDPSARTSVEAWNSIRTWSEHKARILGLTTGQQQADDTPSRLHALRQTRRA